MGCDCNVSQSEHRDSCSIYVSGQDVLDFIKKYITVDGGTKRIKDNIYNTSLFFRYGLINGLDLPDDISPSTAILTTDNEDLCQ